MKKGLFALALGTFTLGMTEFIIEGIITDVAHNMNVSFQKQATSSPSMHWAYAPVPSR